VKWGGGRELGQWKWAREKGKKDGLTQGKKRKEKKKKENRSRLSC